ncbi:C4-dicarboxylate ABC transporter permease [Marinomonas ushuaiensis DSM 15871]|uniref:TRAP transporter large permease protein n=1 Tax=Marinomonas ushuaiensis DSM 15871 TaxID=1122207 RepID=X7E595_9GAMM|nr:TRAP transporter large permease [Marinomonas ushuaiensis]ETX11127.1 C4-dicarboxylate ABC transporter permease [Marinomonas ushuaiensis DSM 15871]
MITLLLPLFLILLLLGLPIYGSLAFSVIGSMELAGAMNPTIVPMRMFSGINNFSLMAIPFFILAAELMRVGGLSTRLIKLAQVLIGWAPGGLASAAVLSCLFFGSISGSSPATVVAIGSIMFPALVEAGYSKRFAIGLLTTAGTLGPIVPPSIALIIYGSVTATSIGQLFAAGILPALLLGGMLIIYCMIYSKKKQYARTPFPTLKEISAAFKGSAWGLGLPVILLGGIYSGIFTATESAAVACLYGLFVGMVIYKQVSAKDLWEILQSTGLISGSLLLITAGASAFSWLLTITGTPSTLANAVLSLSDSSFAITALLNLIMLVAGFFLDSASAIIVLAPLMTPIAAQVGIDPVHFGIINLVNYSVGMITPPVGLNLFVAVSISKMGLFEIFKGCIPFLLILLVGLMIITYIPWLSLAIPSYLF